MKKKLISAICLSAVAASSVAKAQDFCGFDGFFIGLSGGLASTNANIHAFSPTTYTDGFDFFTNTLNLDTKSKITQNRGIIAATLGYSWLCDKLYLGVELGGSYSPNHLNESFDSGSNYNDLGLIQVPAIFSSTLNLDAKAKLRKWEWTADFTPGVVPCDGLLVFGRIGVAWNQLHLDTNTVFNYVDNLFDFNGSPFTTNNNVTIPLALSQKKNRSALRLGVGIAHYISDNFVLSANYIYTDYGKVCVTDSTSIPIIVDVVSVGPTTVLGSLPSTTNVHVWRQSITIGLNYYFGGLFN
jgi:opacity protein-like surface antigen